MDFTKKNADPDPIKQFDLWFQDSLAAEPDLPEAASLSTAGADGRPSARVVLLKGFDEKGFVFYTNYESRKGRDLAENPYAALVFHWRQLTRQISIIGRVAKVSLEESAAYFKGRPRGSQIGAHASRQSQVISCRDILEKRIVELTAEYEGEEIPLPSFWGGYCLRPESLEFWQGRSDRLHDRLLYTRQSDGKWQLERLSP
ncbi:MAG: pyridoxamine 5'-phosphate oxidase [Acidobacteriota bacterium]